jgi:hypothetical protein
MSQHIKSIYHTYTDSAKTIHYLPGNIDFYPARLGYTPAVVLVINSKPLLFLKAMLVESKKIYVI